MDRNRDLTTLHAIPGCPPANLRSCVLRRKTPFYLKLKFIASYMTWRAIFGCPYDKVNGFNQTSAVAVAVATALYCAIPLRN